MLLSGSSSLLHTYKDYTRQVHLPLNPQQPGPIYFKTTRKCSLFGICCEGLPRQINYVIDEAITMGKGTNATISYLHNFFSPMVPEKQLCTFMQINLVSKITTTVWYGIIAGRYFITTLFFSPFWLLGTQNSVLIGVLDYSSNHLDVTLCHPCLTQWEQLTTPPSQEYIFWNYAVGTMAQF